MRTKRPKLSDVMARLSPEEAADRARSNPDSVLLTVDGAMKVAGLTRTEMLEELQSGRLRAVKVRDDHHGGYWVMITAGHLLDWQVGHARRKRMN
jgi:hypothetical protein